MEGTSLLPVNVIASLIANAVALNADSALKKSQEKENMVPMMIIIAFKYINMKCYSSRLGKALKKVRNHFSGPCTNIFTFQPQIDMTAGSSTYIHHTPR